jgi:selenocysteine lyase/cysteine desulfurase
MTAPVYLNHAGCSKVSGQTLDVLLEDLEREAAVGVYEADRLVAGRRPLFYELASELIGANPCDIAYTDSHTTGWETALRRVKVGPGDEILTSRSEWGGNLKSLHALAEVHGAHVRLMPLNSHGTVCVERLTEQLNTRVKLISLTWLGSNGGNIEPAAEIGRLAQSCGIPYFLDASQVVGQLPVDVSTLGCDVLTTPGRKWLRGPRGTGFMYVRPSFFADTQKTNSEKTKLVESIRQLEPASYSVTLMLGLTSALEQLRKEGHTRRFQSLLETSQWIWEGLRKIPNVTCLSERPPLHALVSFIVDGLSAQEVKNRLQKRGIEVAANQAEFTPLDMQARQLDAVVRASAHTCTAQAEIEQFLDAVAQL